MQVRELIEHLRALSPDAVVVVGGEIIHGVEIRPGTVEIGHFNPIFRFDPYGKSKALVFLGNTELTTGEVVSSPK